MGYRQFIQPRNKASKWCEGDEIQIPLYVDKGFEACGIIISEDEDSSYDDERNPDTGFYGCLIDIVEFNKIFKTYFQKYLKETVDNFNKFEKVNYFEYVFFEKPDVCGHKDGMLYSCPTYSFLSNSIEFIRIMKRYELLQRSHGSKYDVEFYFTHGWLIMLNMYNVNKINNI